MNEAGRLPTTPRDLPIHPVAFAATIVLNYWVETVVSPYAAVRALLVAVAVALALLTIAWLLTRHMPRAGVYASLAIGLLYSKFLVVLALEVGAVAPLLVVAMVSLIVAVGWLLVRIINRSGRAWGYVRVNRLLNVVSVVYLLTTLALAAVGGVLSIAARDLDQGEGIEALAGSDRGDDGVDRPDIYLILLDGYPRADVLERAFGIDNRPFLEALASRGFDVATESGTPYLWTQHSLTSMLYMKPAEDVPEFQAVVDGDLPPDPTLRDILNDNPVFTLARDEGYLVAATGYEFEQVALRQADVYLSPNHMNEFELNLLVSTYLGDIVAAIAPDFASGQHRGWIEFQTATLEDVAAAGGPRPRLVMGHIPAPHQPAVYGRDGEPRTVPMDRRFFADSPVEREEPPERFAERYRDQLAYLNNLYLEMVDGILTASNEPPVIVLWGDHGSASSVDWNDTLPEDADSADLEERTSTLFAALTPDRTDVFPEDIQPADIFRLVSDAYLGTDLGRAASAAP